MNKPLKLIKIGNSTGVILPKEVLARLHVELGDEIYLSDAPDGYRMTPSDPDFDATMQIAEDIMKEDRDSLRVQIGRASYRERGGTYVYIAVVAVTLTKKTYNQYRKK